MSKTTAGIPKGGASMTLEAARAVIAAHAEAENKQKVAAASRHIGHFFRFRNSYGGDHKKWWLYVAVTGVQSWGAPCGWSFQRTSADEADVRLSNEETFYIDSGGYQEIDATEFWAQAAALSATLAKRLAPSGETSVLRSL